MKHLRVMHFTESFGWSGGAAQSLSLALELRKLGIDNVFACPAEGDLGLKVKLNDFQLLDFNPASKMDLGLAYKVSKLLEELKPDVIHAHHPKAHNVCLVAKIFSGHKPVLIVSRRVSHPLPRNFLARLKYRTRLVNGYAAVCEYVKQILVDYGIGSERIEVIYSGVDKAKYLPKEKDLEFRKRLGIAENCFLISMIGNYSRDKGQDIFIQALSEIKDAGNFKVLFAGRDTDGENIKKEFLKQGLNPDIGLFLGLRNDVDRILNISDISVNSSRSEALAGTIRESLACGIPVVASDVGGNGEILKDGVNGFLVKREDRGQLAGRIEALMKDAELRKRISGNAVKTIQEKFTVEKMAENTLKFYMKRIALASKE
jgi:glycosyltransferase involved in cell wall biosynthesis